MSRSRVELFSAMNITEVVGVIGALVGLFTIAKELSSLLKVAYRLVHSLEETRDSLTEVKDELRELSLTVEAHQETIAKQHEDVIDLRVEMERLNISIESVRGVLIQRGIIPIPGVD